MNQERWERLRELYYLATELGVEDRAEFLERECGNDLALLQELKDMVEEQPASDFLVPPSGESCLLEGKTLGDFELKSEIGRGAMGVVYRARQVSLDREVAVKVLLPHVTLTTNQVERFQNEARGAARLRHPKIVPVYTVGEHAGTHYFAMELIHGSDLGRELEILRGSRKEPPSLPPFSSKDYFAKVAELIVGAAEALHHAHEAGIVHRDVKPHNLIVHPESKLMVVDFGLAKDESAGGASLSGAFAGTPSYMSPEQARAQAGEEIDFRTDIYSLGVVLYELLTLKPPFGGKGFFELVQQIATSTPAPINKVEPRVPRDLATICEKAIEKDRAARYASAEEFALDLRRFLNHQAIEARAAGFSARVNLAFRLHRQLISTVALCCCAFAAGMWTMNFLHGHRVLSRAERSESIRIVDPNRDVKRIPSISEPEAVEEVYGEYEFFGLRRVLEYRQVFDHWVGLSGCRCSGPAPSFKSNERMGAVAKRFENAVNIESIGASLAAGDTYVNSASRFLSCLAFRHLGSSAIAALRGIGNAHSERPKAGGHSGPACWEEHSLAGWSSFSVSDATGSGAIPNLWRTSACIAGQFCPGVHLVGSTEDCDDPWGVREQSWAVETGGTRKPRFGQTHFVPALERTFPGTSAIFPARQERRVSSMPPSEYGGRVDDSIVFSEVAHYTD